MHPHRSSALGYAPAASAAHSRVYGACAAEAAASESSGLSVGGCIRAWADFRPYPVSRLIYNFTTTKKRERAIISFELNHTEVLQLVPTAIVYTDVPSLELSITGVLQSAPSRG